MLLERNQKVQSYRLHLVCLCDLRSSSTGNSTFSLTPVDPKFGPIINTLSKCVYGGAAGYRPRVQFVVDWLQRYSIFITLICSVVNYFGKKLLSWNIIISSAINNIGYSLCAYPRGTMFWIKSCNSCSILCPNKSATWRNNKACCF